MPSSSHSTSIRPLLVTTSPCVWSPESSKQGQKKCLIEPFLGILRRMIRNFGKVGIDNGSTKVSSAKALSDSWSFLAKRWTTQAVKLGPSSARIQNQRKALLTSLLGKSS